MNNIHEHLCRVAAEISRREYEGVASPADWAAFRDRIRGQFLEMIGLDGLPDAAERGPVPHEVTGVLQRDGYRIEKLVYQSLPRLYVTANLYVPDHATPPLPAVLYVCGHSLSSKESYQHHARHWAQMGFVCLVLDTVQLGEIRGYHHGTYRWGWFHWFSKGYTPAGTECVNGIRGIDLLSSRADVDPQRIGVTGISGGGGASWWVGCADPRVRAVAPVCGTGTIESHARTGSFDEHCDCMFYPNIYGWDLHHIGVLIAPRPLLIANMDTDGLYEIGSVRAMHQRLARVYHELGQSQNLQLVVTPGGHGYHEISRKKITAFFLEHLAGRRTDWQSLPDVQDTKDLSSELKALRDGPPADEKSSIVQDWLVPRAQPPVIESPQQLEDARDQVRAELTATTFNHFPRRPGPLNVQTLLVSQAKTGHRTRLMEFDSESDWRLRISMTVPASIASQSDSARSATLVSLRSPGEGRDERYAAEGRLGEDRWRHVFAAVEPRGTGATEWSAGRNWSLRRTAWLTGRTLASMRVWDTLRALQAVREQPEVDPDAITLVADGEMAPVAVMAALLDGRLRRLALDHVPATFNQPSQSDGRGAAIEMLGVLRVVDLPVAVGLLWPTEVVFIHSRPEEFAWAEDLYARLGPPGAVFRAKEVRTWTWRD